MCTCLCELQEESECVRNGQLGSREEGKINSHERGNRWRKAPAPTETDHGYA